MRNAMTSQEERQLMRLLHGELPADEAARWRRRLETDPELGARYAELERQWTALDLPAPAPAGSELVAAVRRRLDRESNPSLVDMWRLAPAWNRALAAIALAGGIGIGVLAGSVGEAQADDSLFTATDLGLAEGYWEILEEGSIANDGAASDDALLEDGAGSNEVKP